MIKNVSGDVAGILLKNGVKDNKHILITGCSGEGKTYFLCQLMYLFKQKNKKVVVFDNSNSFNKKDMLELMSEEFMDNNINYKYVNQHNFPVNIWDLSFFKEKNIMMMTNYISSIIQAALKTNDEDEKIVINNVVSQTLKEKSYDGKIEKFDIEYFISKFEEMIEEKDGNIRKLKKYYSKRHKSFGLIILQLCVL